MNNITVLYIHLNAHGDYVYSDIPDYAEISVRQTRKFHKGRIVYASEKKADWFDELDVEWVDIVGLNFTQYHEYLSLLQEIRRHETSFWYATMLRMHYIYSVIDELKLEKTLYLENDNLIYHSPDKIHYCFNGKVRYTRVSDLECSPGIMLFPSPERTEEFYRLYCDTIQSLQYKRLTDMTVLSKLSENGLVDLLPSLPENEGVLFDGASYGQYLGGTNNGHPQGFTDPNHHVGRSFRNGRIMLSDDLPPLVEYEGEEDGDEDVYTLFNLHIHSKKLKDFTV